MLLYKSWLDTRWRFLIGLAVLVVAACGTVLSISAGAANAAGDRMPRNVAGRSDEASGYRGRDEPQ